jgi:hypothetical protein
MAVRPHRRAIELDRTGGNRWSDFGPATLDCSDEISGLGSVFPGERGLTVTQPQHFAVGP